MCSDCMQEETETNTLDSDNDNALPVGDKKKSIDDKVKGGSQVTANAGYGTIPNGVNNPSGKTIL